MKEFTPIFLFGVGRSGTTLLQTIINAHPKMGMLPENHFLLNFYLPTIGPNAKSFDSKLPFQDEEFCRIPKEIRNLLKEKKFNSSIDFYSDILEKFALLNDFQLVGDKDPEHINYLPHLIREFPRAKFIHIVRDPRDVILSRKKSDWGKKYPILWHIVEYKHQFLKAQNFSTNNKQFFQIKYEDLLVYPEETLKTLCNFLQVDFDPSMLNHHQHKNNLFSEKETTWKQNVKKPILQDNFNKWKKTIEPSTLKLIENVLWGLDIFKIYKPSFTHQPSLGIIDKMFLSFYLWYINRKDRKKYKL